MAERSCHHSFTRRRDDLNAWECRCVAKQSDKERQLLMDSLGIDELAGATARMKRENSDRDAVTAAKGEA